MRRVWYVLDADNRPVAVPDLDAWAQWWERNDRPRVGYTEITSGCHVSTVFLGVDHRRLGHGPPVLFETMIFGGPLNEYQWRYSSWDDAETGHKAAVRKAREAVGQKVRE